MMFKKIAAAAVLACAASASFAAGPYYAGVDAGVTNIHGSDGETSFGGFLGYRFTPNLAVEGGYRRIGNWDLGHPDLGGVGYTVNQAHLSAVGTLPLSNGLSVYGRLGVSNTDATVKSGAGRMSRSEAKALYGVGLGYEFNGNVAGRVEVQKPNAEFTNVSASVVYSF